MKILKFSVICAILRIEAYTDYKAFRQITGKAGIAMIDTYEKDGIIYFREPYRTNMTEWTEGHLDFDALVSSVDFDEDIAVVLAYSKDLEKLKKIRGNNQILGGLSTREVNCID